MFNLLVIQDVADVVGQGLLRQFWQLEHNSLNNWASACRIMELEGGEETLG